MVEIIEILTPTFHLLVGGLLAIMGSVITQRRDHRRERNEFYRSKIQQCYALTFKVDEAYSQEELTLALLVEVKNVSSYIARKLDDGEDGMGLSDQLLSIIMIYLPDLAECAREYREAEARLVVKKARLYEDYRNIKKAVYEAAIKDAFTPFWEKGDELRALLVLEVKKYTP